MNERHHRDRRSRSNERKHKTRRRSHSREKQSHYRDKYGNFGDEYWEERRHKRDKIMRKPRKQIWRESPTREEIKEIQREHKKIKEMYKKENEEIDEKIKDAVVNVKERDDITLSEVVMKEKVESDNKIEDDNEYVIGPILPSEINSSLANNIEVKKYGDNISRNEGTAFAAFISQGKRIPRRGEIGLSSNQITEYERAGYVMSGSKNLKMEAVRIRKENQVMTAEEQILMKKHNIEAKKEEEEKIMEQFKLLIQSKKNK
uniref:Nkap_C domain-containing protein n=1 Tax=Parastrongyloides trichosuri TaxID=131310 RepID=A0A0N4Z0N7_PARTI